MKWVFPSNARRGKSSEEFKKIWIFFKDKITEKERRVRDVVRTSQHVHHTNVRRYNLSHTHTLKTKKLKQKQTLDEMLHRVFYSERTYFFYFGFQTLTSLQQTWRNSYYIHLYIYLLSMSSYSLTNENDYSKDIMHAYITLEWYFIGFHTHISWI